MVDYTFGTIGGGAEEASPYVMGGRSISAPDVGPSVGNYLSVANSAAKYLAPNIYSQLTSWVPSWGEIGSSLGLDGLFSSGGAAAELAATGALDSMAFGGGAAADAMLGLAEPLAGWGGGTAGIGTAGGAAGAGLGGAMAAFGPAAAFLAWAKLMSAINQNTDHPITLGSGYTSLEDGFYGGTGPEVGRAQGLSDLFRGDGSWYEGGDPSRASDLDTSVGSMSWKKSIPAYSVGGAPYRSPELAIASGRQINRGEMGLPVTLEALPNSFNPATDPRLLAGYQGNQSLPVWDAPQALPTDWDTWQDRAQNSGYSNQSNTEAGSAWAPETIQSYVGQQTPRGQEWFRTALTTPDMYAYTGEASPDWSAPLTDITEVPAEMDRFRSRPSLANYQFGALS